MPTFRQLSYGASLIGRLKRSKKEKIRLYAALKGMNIDTARTFITDMITELKTGEKAWEW